VLKCRIILFILMISLFLLSTVTGNDLPIVGSPLQSEIKPSSVSKDQIGSSTALQAEDKPQPLIIEAEASPLNFKLSPDGMVATMLFDRESIEAMRNLISQLEQYGYLGKVKGIIYSAAGITPMLILLGEKEELYQKIELLKQFLPDQTQAHMVVISASLRELTEDDSINIGLTLMPDTLGATVTSNAQMTFQSSNPAQYILDTQTQLTNIPVTKIFQLNEALNRGKVLVSSEVYTRNGTKALLTNTQQVPIFSTDSNKNIMTSYQQLETSVDVIPTTIEYKQDTPWESQVRVDVLVKISVITGWSSSIVANAPIYTTKTFATTRVLKANNERYVVGTFVNDGLYKNQYGIPLLSKIPILKYFFSQDSTEIQRRVAILTLAVRLIPMKVKDLTIDVQHQNPLEMLYERKGSKKDAR
jgi:type II secretory pathway component GspD/PulD (secretin)